MLGLLNKPIHLIDIHNLSFTLINIRLFMNFINKVYNHRGILLFHAFMQIEFVKYKLYYRFRRSRGFDMVKDRLQYIFGPWKEDLITNYIFHKAVVRGVYGKYNFRFPQSVIFFSQAISHPFAIPTINILDSSNYSLCRFY